MARAIFRIPQNFWRQDLQDLRITGFVGLGGTDFWQMLYAGGPDLALGRKGAMQSRVDLALLHSFPAPLASIGDWFNQYGIAIGVLLLILLGPHFVAAQLFAPEAKAPTIIVASLLQTAFAIFGLMGVAIFATAGKWFFLGASAVVFILSVFVMVGLYRFELAKGFGYNAVVAVLAVGLIWVLVQAIPLSTAKQYAGVALGVMSRVESRRFLSEDEAQRAAVKKYPELGEAGTEFNRKFLERHRKYKEESSDLLKSPGWPWVVSEEVAVEMDLVKFTRSEGAPHALRISERSDGKPRRTATAADGG